MGMCLSFGDSFFTGDHETYDYPAKSDRPTNVLQAIMSMSDEEYSECCKEIGLNPETCEPYDIIDVIKETDYCDGPETPVTVYIDSEGYFTLTIYDDRDDEG